MSAAHTPQIDDPLRWIRPPLQERSQQTLDRLIEAARALIEEKGFDDVPVAEIARRANSSVGAFYARFRDKDAILHAIHERFCAEAYATADDALDPVRWRGASIPEIARAVVAFLVGTIRERQGLMRSLAPRVFDPDVRQRSERLGKYVVDGLSRLLLARRAEITHPDPELVCTFAGHKLFLLLEPLVAGIGLYTGGAALSDETIAQETTRSFLAYLGVREPLQRR